MNTLPTVVSPPRHEPTDRAAIAAEARTWLGTPYAHGQRLKGVGADCAGVPLEVYAAVGDVCIGALPVTKPAQGPDGQMEFAEKGWPLKLAAEAISLEDEQ